MAMDGPTMADEILALLLLEFPEGQINAARKKAFDTFCTGVVQHIQTHGVVTVTGVQAGGGSATGTVA